MRRISSREGTRTTNSMVYGAGTRGRTGEVTEHRSPMLRSKLRAPTVPAHFVHRHRLDPFLAEILDRPLTLVNSPAGSGKTTLLASWVAQSSVPAAWLS